MGRQVKRIAHASWLVRDFVSLIRGASFAGVPINAEPPTRCASRRTPSATPMGWRCRRRRASSACWRTRRRRAATAASCICDSRTTRRPGLHDRARRALHAGHHDVLKLHAVVGKHKLLALLDHLNLY